MKKLMSVIICFAMLVSLIPIVSSAAREKDVTYSAISSDEAVIKVPGCSHLHAFVKDSTTASASVNGEEVSVKLLGDTPCIAFVTLHFDSVTKTLEIPLGYTVFSFSGDSLTVLDGADTNYKITAISQAGEEITPETSADDNGNAVYSNTDTHKLLVSIKKTGGTYAFTGTASDMSIAVNKEAASPTVLLFAGLDMSSSFTSPVTIKKDSTSTVTLNALVGHQNKLCDAALNNADLYGATADGGDGTNETFAESAVIKAKASADLTITGGGSLTLECNSKNAVKVGEYGALKIDSLNLNVTSADNGLSSDNTLEISSGNITVDSADDAIRSDPDAVDADAGCAGTITISGGTFNLTAGSDAIQAAQDVTITGGEFDIKTGSGYNDSTFDKDTMSCKGIKASCNTDTSTDTTTDTSDATNTIEISGGTFTLNTADDAIHSDAYIVITGGKFDILTGDDGVHADTSLTLGTEGSTDNSLPDIDVKSSYEGLEGGCVYIYSGKYKVAASDDGINAAGDSNTEGFNPGGGPGRPGQGGFGPSSSTGSGSSSGTTSDSEYNINIYGGYVYINVDGDGIDANTNISLTGGTIISWGQKAGGDNEPLDCDGALTINGATVFASGSGQMVTTPSSSSQAYVQSRSTAISSGKTIDVIYNNSVVFNITAIKDINYTLYSSPDMTSSSGWSISNKSSSVSVPDDLFKAINGATADSSSMIFYGVAPGSTSLDEYLEKSDSCSVEYSDSTLGTGTVIYIYYNYEKVYEYTLLIYGDVNSDGLYDSQDAFIVSCIAESLLTQSDVGAVKYLAADCNHDGTVDSLDSELLYSAGILLETIDQQSTSAEATAESVYTQYLDLIDQNISPTATSQAAETESVETQQAEKSVTEKIIDLITKLINYILNIFSLIF